jgi:Xaa-Pro aminopeptidase
MPTTIARPSFIARPSLMLTLALGLLVWPAEAQVGSPAGPVPVARLTARRAALLERMGNGLAVLASSKERDLEKDYPQDSDYRENNDFFYLTGLEAPGSWLVLIGRDTAPDQVILYLPPRDSITEKWTGPKLGPGPDAVRLTGIADVRPADRVEAELPRLVSSAVATGPNAALYVTGGEEQVGSGLLHGLVTGEGENGPSRRVLDLSGVLAPLRLIKDPEELSRLRRAANITADALKQALSHATPGAWEYEIEAIIEYTFRREGAERVGFPTIVGSGLNGATLHYDKNRRQTRSGELVVMDVGAEFGYYTADVTRTIPVSGRFTPRQQSLYNLVLGTQQAAIDAVRPGTNLGALERVARTYMRDHSGNLCRPGPCNRYFTHALSHWLGMDVHDVGALNARFEPGMVLTVEPGIYIAAESLGIRIEDDVLVTNDGHEVLSQAAPRSVAAIEAARNTGAGR